MIYGRKKKVSIIRDLLKEGVEICLRRNRMEIWATPEIG